MGWCVWTAILAAMPYGVWSFGPLVPGQIGIAAFSFAVILYVTANMLALRLGEECLGAVARVRGILAHVGWVATAALAVAEAYAFVRGDGGLDTAEQIALNNVMSLVEFACAIMAVLCWALVSAGLGTAQATRSQSRLIGLFAAGGIWPTACVLVAATPDFDSILASVVLCAAVFALAFWGAFCWHGAGCSSRDVSALLAGHMTFLAFRSFVGEYRVDLLDAGLPNAAFYAFFLVFVAVLSLALLLRARWDAKGDVGEADLSASDGRQEGGDASSWECTKRHMERHLSGCARSPLTDREAAVLARTALGSTAASIAAELGIAQATVATYRRRGYGKLCLGGAGELRELAAGLDLGEELPETKEAPSPSGEGEAARKPGSPALWAIAFVGIVLVLLSDAPSDVQFGEHWYHRGTFYLTWAVCCVLAILSFVRLMLPRQVTSSTHDGCGPLGRAANTILPPVLVCLLSAGAFCGWSGMWLYMIWGPTLLVVASLVVGRDSLLRAGEDFSFWRVLFRGFGTLFASSLLPLLGSAGIAVTYHWELYFVGVVTDWIYVFFPSLIFLDAAALVYLARVAAVPVVEPTEGEYDRAMHYLQGRGVGGLRGQVAIDLICGYSVLEVCKRRCTTLATVRSYRQRTYGDCNVHHMHELRKLLVEETGFTSLAQLHPPR